MNFMETRNFIDVVKMVLDHALKIAQAKERVPTGDEEVGVLRGGPWTSLAYLAPSPSSSVLHFKGRLPDVSRFL